MHDARSPSWIGRLFRSHSIVVRACVLHARIVRLGRGLSAFQLGNARHQHFDLEVEFPRRFGRERQIEHFGDEAMPVVPVVATQGRTCGDAIDHLRIDLARLSAEQPLKRIRVDAAHPGGVLYADAALGHCGPKVFGQVRIGHFRSMDPAEAVAQLFQVISVDQHGNRCWVRRWPLARHGSPVFELPLGQVQGALPHRPLPVGRHEG